MSANCCTHTHEDKVPDSRYRRVLCAVLAINGAMFLIEIIAGVVAGSASLQADALDFLADAANYLISLFVVGMALRYRASAALAKGVTMGLFGLGAERGLLACRVWNCTGSRDNGRGGYRSAPGQCRIFRFVVGLQGRRQQFAIRVAVLAQRCYRKFCRAAGGLGRI